MKKKIALLNVCLTFSVLFAILFQSLHSYEHFLNYDGIVVQLDSQNQDVHVNDHNHQECFVCEFTFSSFIASENTSFQFKQTFEAIRYSFFYNETPSFFLGNHPPLRGPPYSIC
jgi:hypothetical protein